MNVINKYMLIQIDQYSVIWITSKQRFISRSRIPTPGCQSMRKCVEVYSMKKTAWYLHEKHM